MPVVEIDVYKNESGEVRDRKLILAWNECHPESAIWFWRGREIVLVDDPGDDGIADGAD